MGIARLQAILDQQGPRLVLWTPVLFACGIGTYFSLPSEPAPWMLIALGGLGLLGIATCFRVGRLGRVGLVILLMPSTGFVVAAVRTNMVAAPVLAYERTVAIEGRVIGISRSASNLPRVLLDKVVIYGLNPSETPKEIRISLPLDTSKEFLVPGRRITGTARMSPPGGPTEPGGFDFRQIAFFDGLGAVGYSRAPMLEVEGSETSMFHQMALRARMSLSARIQARISGQNGAFGAAILTGDRSAMAREVEDDLRISTLYHLVSISGLHMGLLAAAVFAIVRYGLAVVPWCALRWPLKKIAAVAALIGGAAYLVISGMEVATQRSYVMTTVVLVAVLLDRPALTMRAVALAAFVVLICAPESLIQAGFQMSFSATIALIASFEGLRRMRWWKLTQTDPRWRFVKPVLGVAMTSLVAGLATAPVSAFHFNTMSQFGLLANLLAVPAMGIVVMPVGVIALILLPFGLDWLPFTVMGWGIGYILAVAHFVAGLGGAVVGVHSGPGISLVLLAIGGLIVVLWGGRGRWVGVAPALLGLFLWSTHQRPEILIADNGRLFGVMTDEGRALSVARGNGFAAENWLRRDGDIATQAEAAARGEIRHGRYRIEADVPGLGMVIYNGSAEADTGDRDCAGAAILIAPKWIVKPRGECLFINSDRLRSDGAISITVRDGGMKIETALARDGARPWTGSNATRPLMYAPPAAVPMKTATVN